MKKTIYLYKSGTLKRKDFSLACVTKDETIPIPIRQVDLIICFSEITMNKRVLELLNTYGITIFFFTYNANYIGQFLPKQHYDGSCLVKQVHAYDDEDTRLYIAKQMTYANLHNCLSVLKYYQKKGRFLESEIFKIEKLIQTIKNKNSINELLLLEARAKQFYYLGFDEITRNKYFCFVKRMVYPPKNEMNAMMSYGYSLLYSHYLSVLYRSSLLPSISFIHSMSKSKDSLQYDLADILKPVLVDRLIFRLIRKNQVKKDMFEYGADGGCYLNAEGASFFVKEFDKQLRKSIHDYSYRRLISKEVHELSNYIRGKSEAYTPFLIDW